MKTEKEKLQAKFNKAKADIEEIDALISSAKNKQIEGRKEEIELTLKKRELKGKLAAREEDLKDLEK